MMPYTKNIKCENCPNEFLAVGSDDPTVSMSTSPDGAIAHTINNSLRLSTDGLEQEIVFEANCPVCGFHCSESLVRPRPVSMADAIQRQQEVIELLKELEATSTEIDELQIKKLEDRIATLQEDVRLIEDTL
ncbi:MULTISPECIES: hypothetical protein [unclassified Lysinibacillus]|uniref:hypothetical protein n=1 Tax=unclassified Lysinibacillus TaxID=2636778 RepID=UPI00381B611C